MRAAEPFDLADLTLRNRLVGTAHGRGILEDGLPLPEDAEYWRRRAAGGAAMLTVGGTVVAPRVDVAAADHHRGVAARGGAGDGRARGGDPRRGRGRGVPARAPRPRDDRRRAVVPPGGAVGGALAARADAAAAAERRRARRDRRGLPRLGGQRRRGGLPGHRAARRARLPARAVPVGGDEPARLDADERLAIVARIVREIRSSAPGVVVGIRLSIGRQRRAPGARAAPASSTRSPTT